MNQRVERNKIVNNFVTIAHLQHEIFKLINNDDDSLSLARDLSL